MNQITDVAKRPLVMVLISLVIGLFFGSFWAWYVQPVQWYDAPVNLLRRDLRADYLRMTIDSWRVNGDDQTAFRRYDALAEEGPAALQDIMQSPGKTDPQLINKFGKMVEARQPAAQPTPAEGQSSGDSNLLGMVLIVVAVLVIGAGVAYLIYNFFLRGYIGKGNATAAQQAAEISRNVEKTDYSTMASTPPVAQYVTTYMLGDDLFDDSFSIDSQSGEFLGECGVGISETIGVGDPKKVAAFEVWMFDKNDIQTVTKVVMSPHTFNDSVFRGKLESKGELFAAGPRKQVVLETQTLQMVVTVVDVQYGQSALPAESYFERITIELAIWNK